MKQVFSYAFVKIFRRCVDCLLKRFGLNDVIEYYFLILEKIFGFLYVIFETSELVVVFLVSRKSSFDPTG